MNSLFPDNGLPETGNVSGNGNTGHGPGERGERIRRSALWAAYGDALGWISELTDSRGLGRRTGGRPLREPIEWNRRVGGRSGVVATLPRGCYSDDSQLRLAVSRAIRPDGFDVEAFAKVELPVWLSYGLGGGRSTIAAAANLAKKPRLQWFSNTFKGWTRSGGNGAAMRIQPHVWSARTPEEASSFLPDVARDAVCTHSHPHGLMGAAIHALCLAHAMVSGRCPSPEDLLGSVGAAENLLREIMESDTELSYWRAAYEKDGEDFFGAWKKTADEAREAVAWLADICASRGSAEERYGSVIEKLGLRDPARRGSGMLTAAAAAGLGFCEPRPEEAMRIAANALGTDTDTIATMAGAIVGATAGSDPPSGSVLDEDLFRSDAARLAEIAAGGDPAVHRYPDLLRWSAPKSRSEALVRSDDGSLIVRGLGPAAKMSREPLRAGKGDFQWQWIKLETGQTLLIKSRGSLAVRSGEDGTAPRPRADSRRENEAASRLPGSGKHLPGGKPAGGPCRTPAKPPSRVRGGPEKPSLKDVLIYVEKHIDSDEKVGAALRRVASKGTRGEVFEFTAKLIDILHRYQDSSPKR